MRQSPFATSDLRKCPRAVAKRGRDESPAAKNLEASNHRSKLHPSAAIGNEHKRAWTSLRRRRTSERNDSSLQEVVGYQSCNFVSSLNQKTLHRNLPQYLHFITVVISAVIMPFCFFFSLSGLSLAVILAPCSLHKSFILQRLLLLHA